MTTVWKGRFSPQGMAALFTLERSAGGDSEKQEVTREEAFSLIFGELIRRSDLLLDAPGVPDFNRIRSTLESARPYAVLPAAAELLEKRLDKIDMMALVYKADVLSQKGTTTDLQTARESLETALTLNLEDSDKAQLRERISEVDGALQSLSGSSPGSVWQ